MPLKSLAKLHPKPMEQDAHMPARKHGPTPQPAVLVFDIPVAALEALSIWTPCCLAQWQLAVYASRFLTKL
jgi:hypothetical protein